MRALVYAAIGYQLHGLPCAPRHGGPNSAYVGDMRVMTELRSMVPTAVSAQSHLRQYDDMLKSA